MFLARENETFGIVPKWKQLCFPILLRRKQTCSYLLLLSFLFCLVRSDVHSPSRNLLFSQPRSFSLSDHLLPTHSQNEELNLNVCPEPLHTRREGTVAICMLLGSVQCKTASTSIQMLSCSGRRVEGIRNNMILSLKCN